VATVLEKSLPRPRGHVQRAKRIDVAMTRALGANEQGKARRRAQLMGAAEALIRETGSTSFSMNDLAQRAGLSTPTTYNLIGSKAAVLYNLLNDYQDGVEVYRTNRSSGLQPYQDVMDAAENAVKVYVDDSEFIKPLMLFLIGVNEPERRQLFMERGYRYWRESLSGLVERNVIGDRRRNLIARDFVIHFTGLIDFWAQGAITDDEFLHSARHASLLRLASIADGGDREDILERLRLAETMVAIEYEPAESEG
jgi:AcrR family transcriptional regulator